MTPVSATMPIIAASCHGFEALGHSDLGGRGHSDQVMVVRGHAYIGHSKTRGTSVVDVRDPRQPRVVNLLPHHAGSWAIHLQAHGELLLVAEALDFRAVMSDHDYYLRAVGGFRSESFGRRAEQQREYASQHPR